MKLKIVIFFTFILYELSLLAWSDEKKVRPLDAFINDTVSLLEKFDCDNPCNKHHELQDDLKCNLDKHAQGFSKKCDAIDHSDGVYVSKLCWNDETLSYSAQVSEGLYLGYDQIKTVAIIQGFHNNIMTGYSPDRKNEFYSAFNKRGDRFEISLNYQDKCENNECINFILYPK